MELKRYRITILTTGQPSTNPRLVKEADTLAKMGYMVFVYYCYWSDWAFKNDFDLLEVNIGNIFWLVVIILKIKINFYGRESKENCTFYF